MEGLGTMRIRPKETSAKAQVQFRSVGGLGFRGFGGLGGLGGLGV